MEPVVADVEQEKMTRILTAAGSGDKDAAAKLWDMVYEELHDLAARKMAHNRPGQTLQPTALVHEAYLRLVGKKEMRWDNRAHFFGAAARAMRNILVDRLRRGGRIRHGAGRKRVSISKVELVCAERDIDLLALDEALDRLEKHDKRLCDMTLLRFFAGLTIEDTALALGVSTSTVERDWAYARAWLFREMSRGENGPDGGEKD
jgi:RNA polymerase sigma factor (TIGR02999 family)